MRPRCKADDATRQWWTWRATRMLLLDLPYAVQRRTTAPSFDARALSTGAPDEEARDPVRAREQAIAEVARPGCGQGPERVVREPAATPGPPDTGGHQRRHLPRATLLRARPGGAALSIALLVAAALSTALLLNIHPRGPVGARIIRVGRTPIAVAVASASGRAVVANEDDGTLSLLDAHSGAVLRTIPLGQHPTALALDEAAGRIFTLNTAAVAIASLPYPFGAGMATLSVLDLHTGAILRTVPLGTSPNALAVDEPGGRLVVTSGGDDTVRLLDARTGQVLRTVALDGVPQAVAVAPAAGRMVVSTDGHRGRVALLDSRSGRLLRTLTLGRAVGAVVAVPGAGRLVVPCDGRLQLLDLHSGALVGTVPAAAVPLQATAGGDVLVTGAAGLRLLDARTRRWAGPWVLGDRALQPVWSEDVARDDRSGTVVVAVQPARGPSALVVLSTTSGRVRRLIPVGPPVGALAVDARTHTAFALTPQEAVPGRPSALAAVLAWGQRWWSGLTLPGVTGAQEAHAGGSVHVVALR